MTDEPARPVDDSAGPSHAAGPPKTYASLARIIARRTTDCLAIALLLTAGIYIGTTLSRWWNTDPSEIATTEELARAIAGSEITWGTDGSPVFLEFGSQPGELRRQTFHGSETEAVQELIRSCEPIVKQSPEPVTAADSGELRLLDRLKTLQPTVASEDGWRIDHVAGPVSLVVGSRRYSSPGPVRESGAGGWRVVCWGLMFPAQAGSWTLFTFSLSDVSFQDSPWPDFPLPSNCRRNLSVRSRPGSMLIGFSGLGPEDLWKTHFQESLADQQWTTSGWRPTENGWSAVFQSNADNKPGLVEIQFTKSLDGLYRGLITATPAPTE